MMDKESVTAAPARGRREPCISWSGSSGFASVSLTTTTTTTSGSVHQVRWRGSSHASPSQHQLQLQVEGPYVPLQPSAQARTARGTAASRATASVGSHGNWGNSLSHAVTLLRFRDLESCAHRGPWDGTIRTQRRTASVTSLPVSIAALRVLLPLLVMSLLQFPAPQLVHQPCGRTGTCGTSIHTTGTGNDLRLVMSVGVPGVLGAASAAQRSSLVDLYMATGGTSNWTTNVGWLSGDPCSLGLAAWYGVGCDLSGTVITYVGFLALKV